MAIAPFIRPIQMQGGTFYTFVSAAEDLSLTFNNSGKKFSFSKYALLDLPDIKRPEYPSPNEENVIQLDAIPGAFALVNNSKTYNTMFAESLQNYVLNLETAVTSFATYDVNTLQTSSERIFFKWLKEIGALRFRAASAQESVLTTGLRYTEESNSANYTSVVKYIGDIDLVNSLKSTEDAYSEIYVNIPTKDGATPLILFKSTDDNNYYAGQNLINSPVDPLNTGYLYGRTFNQTNPSGLSTLAFFDSKFSDYGPGATQHSLLSDVNSNLLSSGEYQLFKFNESTSQYEVDWWFLYPDASSYWSQPPAASGTFDSWSNASYLIRGYKEGVGGTVTSVNFRRSDLDGIGLDFNVANYVPIATNPAISSFSDFNSVPESVSFRFNAVLVYYDVIDSSTGVSATNLFGVLFLDDVRDTLTGGSYIPRLDKYKPNRITGLNGNAYGLKINLKFDTNSDEAAVVSAVNEYSPFSLHVFLDALNRMQTVSNNLIDYQNQLLTQQLQINQLNDIVVGATSISDINKEIVNINSQLANAKLMFTNSATIMDLIQRNYTEIQNIYNNLTTVQMTYNLDVIKQGPGISLDRSVPNQIGFSSNIQQYNTPSIVNVLTDFTPKSDNWSKIQTLNNYTNYLKISNGINNAFNRDVNIYINDTDIRWHTGQTYKLVVDRDYQMDMYTLGSYNLNVYTDALDRAGNGVTYGVQIGLITSADFYNAQGAPQIEIVCLDAQNFVFTFDLKY